MEYQTKLMEQIWQVIKAHQFGGVADVDLEDEVDQILALIEQGYEPVINENKELREANDRQAEFLENCHDHIEQLKIELRQYEPCV